MLDDHPQAALQVLVVWVPMLASDSLAEADKVSALIPDRRATHFYDSKRWAAQAIAASVGGADAVAWDTYLFYRPGAGWADAPPLPERWMHQLGPSGWADPQRFRWADSLTAELRAAAEDLLA